MTRRLRRIGTVRKLPSGRYEVRVRGRSPDGTPFNLRRVVSSAAVAQVQAEFRAQAREIKDGLARPRARCTLFEYSRGEFQKVQPWSPERESTFRILRPLWDRPLSSIDDSAVSRWASEVVYLGDGRAPRGSGKAGKTYLIHAFELLRRILRQAVSDKLIPAVALSRRPPGIPPQKQARKQRRPLSDDELSALLRAAEPEPELHLQLLLQACTGLRPVELISCKSADLWPAEDFCREAPAGAGVLRCDPCKGGAEHLAPLPPVLSARLRAHVATLEPAARATGLIFPELFEGRWRARRVWISHKRWRALFDSAGIPRGVVLYQLRHTRLSEWSNRTDIGARRAADLVGHSDMRTTEGYAARARGLVPQAFEPPRVLCAAQESVPPKPDPEPPENKPRTRKRQESVPSICPRIVPCPERAHKPETGRLRALAARLQAEGPGPLADTLETELGPECVIFAAQLRAELQAAGDPGLSARIEPLLVSIRARWSEPIKAIEREPICHVETAS